MKVRELGEVANRTPYFLCFMNEQLERLCDRFKRLIKKEFLQMAALKDE